MTRRTRRNAARVAALALTAASLLLLAGVGSAGADGSGATLEAKGWWWEAQQLPAPLPPPPNVQPGQLNVQGSPADKKGSAFAAVRFAVGAEQTAQTLTMNVAANGDSGVPAVLLACRTGSRWVEAEAGQWSAAPTVDDKACVNGTKAADGKSWAFAVGPLQVGTVLDIAIVPGVDPSSKTTAPFSVVFDAPTSTAVATAGGAAPTVPLSSPPLSFSGNGTPTPSNSFVAPPVITPVATGLPADKLGQTATAPSAQAATQPGLDAALTAGAKKERDRRIGYVVLVLAAVIGAYAWRQDNLMAMNGGTLPGAADEPGGLGRFARPRQGQPPALT